jgi:hypothetical protein
MLRKLRCRTMNQVPHIEELKAIGQGRVTNRRCLVQFWGEGVIPDVQTIRSAVRTGATLDLTPIINGDLA